MNTLSMQSAAAPPAAIDPRLLRGLLVGLVAASIGALYTVFARWGIARGMDSSDMTFLRFGVAGLVTLPVLLLAPRRDARAFFARWRSWLTVALLAGPLFGLLMFTALQWAPASHAAAFPFTAMSVTGTLMSVGMRKQRLDPMLATAVVSFVALVTYLPVYLGTVGPARLLAAAPTVLWTELLVQGLIAGAGTLYAYSKMVSLLGPARAAVFPALAPGLAALMARPVLGHVPSGVETFGLVVSVAGLLITVTAGSPTATR